MRFHVAEYSFVASSESCKVLSSFTELIPLGGVGPTPSHTSSSQPLLPQLSVGSCCRWMSGIQKHNMSLVHIRNQVLKVLVSWHSTLLNCSCWSVWLLLLPPPFSCRLRCSALPIMPRKPWYLLSLWWESIFFYFFLIFFPLLGSCFFCWNLGNSIPPDT